MNFLEKLNYLMEKKHLNKNTLSKACHIPYTTIDGWYKRGYEGLKLTTLRKLADFFETSLDYWVSEDNVRTAEKSEILKKMQEIPDNEKWIQTEEPQTGIGEMFRPKSNYELDILAAKYKLTNKDYIFLEKLLENTKARNAIEDFCIEFASAIPYQKTD